MSEILLEARDLARHYRLPRTSLFHPSPVVRAVDGVSFELLRGRSFGIVGESGCGKSTLARLVMALEPPSAGSVRLLGCDLTRLPAGELRRLRSQFQMVFQDPFGSLDPRHTIGRAVGEPLSLLGDADGAARAERVAEALAAVGLSPADRAKYPHEFSGGQRQRIAIARALITRPALIVADEPVSALDVSVRAQVLNLMQDLQDRNGLTYLFISHDLAVVEYVCDEVAVMYLGRIVERGPTQAVFRRPAHPYSRALLDAVPRPEPGRRRRRRQLAGQVGSATERPAGCAFAPRCPLAEPRCRTQAPALRPLDEGRFAACHFAEAMLAG
ncbi:MAG: ATP-binding cassette domain-containing protein [Alphaproteobacteria bacterium]|nr:ATP-binding cassette domain-containing protein [Alphaproteobacteria bacterium]